MQLTRLINVSEWFANFLHVKRKRFLAQSLHPEPHWQAVLPVRMEGQGASECSVFDAANGRVCSALLSNPSLPRRTNWEIEKEFYLALLCEEGVGKLMWVEER